MWECEVCVWEEAIVKSNEFCSWMWGSISNYDTGKFFHIFSSQIIKDILLILRMSYICISNKKEILCQCKKNFKRWIYYSLNTNLRSLLTKAASNSRCLYSLKCLLLWNNIKHLLKIPYECHIRKLLSIQFILSIYSELTIIGEPKRTTVILA